MRKALIVGGTGFVGAHLQRLMLQEFAVTATGHESDIRDLDQMRDLVMRIEPDVVMNLASITTVRESFASPDGTYRIGFLGTLNLLMALREFGFKGRMLNVSSSEVYGHPEDRELPLTEQASIRPMSPYAVSKSATEHLCYQWSQSEQFEIITARPFTHIGPGQSDRFAISNFSKQIAEIILGRREPIIRVGNLETTRDLTDVRDVTDAYRMLLAKGRNGDVYNVCSGQEVSMGAVLRQLIECAKTDIRVEKDKSLVRDAEQRRLCGSYSKLNKETGWDPRVPLEKTLGDTMSQWLDQIK
jgi:GDP-4-dehydro-6-deoxy-D-mannose reductase